MTQVPPIFAQPWVLSLLLAMPLLSLAQLAAAWRGRRMLLRLGQPIALAGLLPPPRRLRWLSGFLFSTGVTALIAGAAGPQWGRDPQPAVMAGRDLIVLLDMSNSMRAADAPPDRFHRGVEAVADLVSYVRTRGGHRLGLVVFAADAQVVCPLTHDYALFLGKLQELDLNHLPPGLRARPGAKSGTRIGAGLRLAVAAHDPAFHGFQDVLLISDGDDPVADGEWEAGLKAIESSEVPFLVVGTGDPAQDAPIRVPGHDTPIMTRLHEAPLRQIAARTGGFYLGAQREPPRLTEVFRQRIESKGATTPQTDPPPLPHPRQVWFYAAAVGLFGLVGLMQVRRSDILMLKRFLTRRRAARSQKGAMTPDIKKAAVAAAVLLTLLAAAPVAPEDWERRGNEAFEAGQFADAARYYARAEEESGEPGRVAYNSGVAHFNLGRYRDAERLFRCALEDVHEGRRGRALYNLATCLIQASEGREAARLGEAINHLERCLDRPDLNDSLRADARHNLELAKQLWRNIRPDASPPENDSGGGDDPTNLKPPESPMGDGSDQDPNGTSGGARPTAVPSPAGADGPKPMPTDQAPAGSGSMSPLTDQEQLRPLPPHEARELLRQAAERITRERRLLQHGGPGEVRSFPDW